MNVPENSNLSPAEIQQKRRELAAAFRGILSGDRILVREEDLRPYECDGLSAYRRLPLLVLIPDSIEEIRKILRVCKERRLPLVCRGAGTGLSAGALPRADGILLSMARFNRILELDSLNRMARVEPGVRNLAVTEAARAHGLYYAPDPSSQIACSIGGNIAENAGGVHCLKYGLTLHNVLEIKFLTIDGDLIEVGGAGLESSGYDLVSLLTGSEGMLGIVVEARLRLLPIPESARVLLAAFDDIVRAGEAVARIIAEGILPAGLEMMDRLAISAAEDFAKAGYPRDAEAILLCELDGTEEEVSLGIERARAILQEGGAREVRLAQDDDERARMWAGRKGAFPAVGRLAPDYYCMDGTIPRKSLGPLLTHIGELSRQYNLPVANVFHAGDGNLHPLILYDANIEGELEKAEEFGARILEMSVEVGGSITGEHGVGEEKLDQMCVQFGEAELKQFQALKKAFDPEGLLNPGKAVPELHRCAELGAMHVHKGRLPFPEIERF